MIKSRKFSSVHQRVFRSMTESDYRDENIQLLFDNPRFAQEMLSTYYPFTRSQYKRYREKIVLGDCYTHDNGMYDELEYEPGFIFNPKCRMDRKLRPGEFKLPVAKEAIKQWLGVRNQDLIFEGYRESPELWDELGEQIDRNWDSVEVFFQAFFDSTYTFKKLRTAIAKGIDIIKEDRIWPDNFELFLNDGIVEELFALFHTVDKSYAQYDMESVFKRKKSDHPSWD